jgi:hypothetical protein
LEQWSLACGYEPGGCEEDFMQTRRRFLTKVLASGLPIAIFARRLAAQTRPTPVPRDPTQKQEEDMSPSKIDSKTILTSNQKDIKKSVERLFQLASDLKAEVEKTDAVKVLSMVMVKKTEEIERLAKEIRSRALG